MDRNISLSSSEIRDVTLRSVGASDQSNLRRWKNDHRESFFYKGSISPADQIKWFQGYLARPDDHMFVVWVDGMPVGCMGFRVIDRKIDAYNIILGVASMGKRGVMSGAFRMLCSYAMKLHSGVPGLKVLKGSPAVSWYKRIGFSEVSACEVHLELELDLAAFRPCLNLDITSSDKSPYGQGWLA